ncbi:solute carrier family 41 member 2 [Gadus macrocephalus]|uniref:solute carrier family 41 member 2 n=1 Tax=Gadus macrocephalus TaxID=80720 RepID=UPI0028CB9077|nr:solute carrier family 41 member 2 [Gadus macrocephalus]
MGNAISLAMGTGDGHLHESTQPSEDPQELQDLRGYRTPRNTSLSRVHVDEAEPLLPGGVRSARSLHKAGGTRGDPQSRGGAPPARPTETTPALVLQILVPFLLAGLGTVSAGMLLDLVQHWEVFQEVTEIFILVPSALGLKGNLEMTLASRLSTAVNTGKMETARERRSLIIGNLSLKQLQATVLGLLAALMAIALGWMAEGQMPFNHALLLCSVSLATAFMASLLQGVIMVALILGSKKLGINPDNVATPLAASFGDLITLAFLASFSRWFYGCLEPYSYVLVLVNVVLLCLIPLWVAISSRQPASRILLRKGWEPIITAMLISSLGGLILDKTVTNANLAGIIIFVPVINGIGGSLVSIQCSRIATALHIGSSPGEVPEGRKGPCRACHMFFGSGANHRSAQVLFLLVIPGQLIFLYTIHLMEGAHTVPTPFFLFIFLAVALLQVYFLLCVADWLVPWLWQRGKDPDSFSIPYLTALGDLLGTTLLSLAFLLFWWTGEPISTSFEWFGRT